MSSSAVPRASATTGLSLHTLHALSLFFAALAALQFPVILYEGLPLKTLMHEMDYVFL